MSEPDITTPLGRAQVSLGAALLSLEAAMSVRPEKRAAYSRWIKAHEHMLAASTLLDLDGVEQITSRDWQFKEISFGCSEHDSPICTLLVNKHDGRQLHIPATDVEVKPSG